MSDLPWLHESGVAYSAALAAGAEIMRQYLRFEAIADAPADISTDADKASQMIIFEMLAQAFPDDGLCGEESNPADRISAGKRVWIVDPIDGTRGFARKIGEFCVMIALVSEGTINIGVVYEPAIDRLTLALRGGGCYTLRPAGNKFEPSQKNCCRVTDTSRLADATMAMSRSRGSGGEQTMLNAFGAARAIQTYSAGIKLAQVARGEADLYLGDYLALHDWDVCAGHILVEEAGGNVTSVDGEPIIYDQFGSSLRGRGLLATNGKLHDAALAVIKSGKAPLK